MNLNKKHISFTNEELNSFLKVAGIIVAGILTLFLLTLTINEVKTYSIIGDDSLNPNAPQNTITVSGEADMDVKPDITTFSWTVESTGTTVEDAQSKAATISNKALAYLKDQGIADADLKLSGYDTETKYENRATPCDVQGVKTSSGGVNVGSMAVPTVGMAVQSVPVNIIMPPCGSNSVAVGFTTTQTVDVKVRNIQTDPSKTGTLVAGLGTIGVKVTNPQSSIENPDIVQSVVRGQAIEKAKQQAVTLASQLGVHLVRVTSFNENSGTPYPMAYGAMAVSSNGVMDKAVAPELPVGTNKVVSNVSITYQIR